jgi:hypothetical protein
MKNHELNFVGIEEGYHVYENSEGFMEGYKKTGKNIIVKKDEEYNLGTDCKRIVTNQKTIEGFGRFVRGLKGGKKIKDRRLDASKLPQLPFND